MSHWGRFIRVGSRGQRRLLKGGLAAATAAVLVVVGATAAQADTMFTGPSATGLTGLRGGATRLAFSIDDEVSASVDVGTGNLNVQGRLLSLQGVSGAVPISIAYNSRDTTSITSPTAQMKGPHTGWTWGFGGTGTLSLAPNGTTIDYTTADGAVWPFVLSGSTYTSPAGLKAILTKTASGFTLQYMQSSSTITFDATGNPITATDKNGNTTAIAFPATNTLSITSSAGPTAARTATLTYAPYTYAGYTYYATTVSQQNGSASRAASVSYSSSGQPTAITDANGAKVGLTYNAAGLVSKVTNPLGATTAFTYDSSNRVTQVDQSNTTSGSAGTSTTRFSYASSTSTLVAGANTSTSSAVSAVPHATYTLDGNHLVTTAVDAAGRSRSATYTPQGLDVASSTIGTSGGTPGSVSTTYGYDSSVNNGLSLTSATGQSGNSSTAAYTNAASSSQYLPSSTTTDANTAASANTTSYTYNGAGNQLTTTGNTTSGSTSSSTAVTSTVTRNSDGSIATATAPGNGSNATHYSYANGQLTQVTPVTGSSLGTKNYTYDAFGRLKTQTDGASNTTTYTYDDDDRVLTTSFSDATGTVTNTWDAAGNLTKQVSDGGTITNTFDQLNHVTSTANTSFGGTISFGYDKAGNNTSISDTRGTTTQTYDDAGSLLTTTYPKASGTATTQFATDGNGNRTDVWLQSNASHSVWAAHTHTAYDQSGRVKEIKAEKGPASSPTTQMDVYYCYNTAGSGTNCGASSASDAAKLQWTYNAVTSQTTKFTYDGLGRLTRVVESGGNDGNDTYAYTYDARGNRLTAAVSGTDSSSQTLTYNAASQITSTGYSYDGAGNMTASPGATYTYNAAEQMTKAVVGSNTTTYTYAGAAQNKVLRETVGGGSTYKLAYGRGGAIAQFGVGSLTAYIETDPNSGQATMLHTSSDIAALYVYDLGGSPVALLTDFNTTSFQYKYDPYGAATLQQTSGGNGVGQNPYAFKGGLQDRATGFVKYGQRWYNPVTGTWTQQDTLDSPLDAGNANRYAYAGDDPVNNSDPSGTVEFVEALLYIYNLASDASSLAGFLNDLGTNAAQRDLVVIADGLIGAAVCTAFVAAADIATLGAASFAEALCALAGEGTSALGGAIYDALYSAQ